MAKRAGMTVSMDQDTTKSDDDIELLEDEEFDASGQDGQIKKMREKLRVCEEEKRGYLDGWQRAQADAVNYKKDEGKRLEDLGRFITQSMLSDLLPVLDSFDLALQSFSAKGGQAVNNQIEQGVLMIRSQLTDVFKKRGVAQIEVTPGEEFNPEKHESIGEVESEKSAGTVAEEVQKGYTLVGRVIRPARVRLAKEPLINFGKGVAAMAFIALEIYGNVTLPFFDRYEYATDVQAISSPRIEYQLPPGRC